MANRVTGACNFFECLFFCSWLDMRGGDYAQICADTVPKYYFKSSGRKCVNFHPPLALAAIFSFSFFTDRLLQQRLIAYSFLDLVDSKSKEYGLISQNPSISYSHNIYKNSKLNENLNNP